ncbi:L-histidine N(alpha)-methyltransferase [Sorlinia euscelidii]|uniref:Methyltransferase type 12 domain-containing protein n=1 Tax=Sorlinia euscelidii TaxID=3081148 RepID=A0ABU7U1L0_9PROT
MNPSDIARGFSRATLYDEAARVQARTAILLRDQLAGIYAARAVPRRILEIGSGTGLMTTALLDLFPQSELIVTDLSRDMLARCREKLRTQYPSKRVTCIAMDGERPSLAPSFDLICSNFCVQWFQNRRESFRQLRRLLGDGGVMAFSTLAEGSFREWHEACAAAGISAGFGPWPSLPSLQAEFPQDGEATWTAYCLTDPVRSGRQFLRDIRRIGAAPSGIAKRPLSPRRCRIS